MSQAVLGRKSSGKRGGRKKEVEECGLPLKWWGVAALCFWILAVLRAAVLFGLVWHTIGVLWDVGGLHLSILIYIIFPICLPLEEDPPLYFQSVSLRLFISDALLLCLFG
jgi:hypothetical protein